MQKDLEQAAIASSTTVCICVVDACTLDNDHLLEKALYIAGSELPYFGSILLIVEESATNVGKDARSFKDNIATLLKLVQGIVGDENKINIDDPLMDFGMTSSTALQLVESLQNIIQREVPPTLVFDYPTIRDIAEFISANVVEPYLLKDPQNMRTIVKNCIYNIVKEDLNDSSPLLAAGLTSTGAVHLVSQLEEQLGYEIPGTLVFDHPTIDAIVSYLTANHADQLSKGARDESNALELKVTKLFKDFLHISNIELGQPLMSAGLTSTGATQLVEILGRNLGVQLPPTFLFDFPTLGAVIENIGDYAEIPYEINLATGVQRKHVDIATESSIFQVLHRLIEPLLSTEEIGASTSLMHSGLSSMALVQFTTTLEETLKIDLPGTFAFDYPTIGSMVEYILEEFVELNIPYPKNNLMTESIKKFHENDVVCVISSAERIPETAVEGIYSALGDGVSCVPLERWDRNCNGDEMNMQFGGFLDGAALFDPVAFHLSHSEAVLIDPQQRLVLDTFMEASIPLHERNLWTADMGVYVGVSQLEYARITLESGISLNAYYATGAHLSVSSGRISYTFGLKGPAVTADTACSSSLVTTHLSVQALQKKSIHLAATIGVNLTLVNSWTQACNRAGMLAQDGRCKTLDSDADGYVRAEAVGAITLALQSSLDTDVNEFVALVGTSVNQDGRSSSLTAPNGPSQQNVIFDALREGSTSAKYLKTIQMHGTGTSLGDPIELGALLAVSSEASGDTGPLKLSAVKSRSGHAEPAAGLLGLQDLKYIEMNQSLQPILHLRSVNPFVEGSLKHATAQNRHLTVFAPKQQSPLGNESKHSYSGVSAFAFMGTNSHCIIKNAHGISSYTNKSTVVLEKRRCWVTVEPFASIEMTSASLHTVCFECSLKGPRMIFLMDHQVKGRVLFPATGMLEMFLASGTSLVGAAEGQLTMGSISITSPLVLSRPGNLQKKATVVKCTLSMSEGVLKISNKEGEEEEILNATGHANLTSSETSSSRREPDFMNCRSLSCSSSFINKGFPQGTKTIDKSPCGNIASDAGPWKDFLCPPQIADSCLHLGVAQETSLAKVPVAIGAFTCSSQAEPEKNQLDAFIELYPEEDKENVQSFVVNSSSGSLQINMSHLETSVLGARQPSYQRTLSQPSTYDLEWVVSGPLGDITNQNSSQSLLLSAANLQVRVEERPEKNLSFTLNTSPPVQSTATGLQAVQSIQEKGFQSVDAIFNGSSDSFSLSGSSSAEGNISNSAVWGLLKTAATEIPCSSFYLKWDDRSRRIPLHKGFNADNHIPEFLEGVPREEWKASGVTMEPTLKKSIVPDDSEFIQIRPQPRGSLSNLVPVSCDPNSMNLSPLDVMMRVKAVGLNFRDVLNVLGMYPGDPGPPGSDTSGVIIRAGDEVTDIRIGDNVFGFAHGCLGSLVTAQSRALVHMPQNLSFHEAATTPTVFVTVMLAFTTAAKAKSGDRILIHAATGGVGLAAMQMVKSVGAVAVTTAGIPSKRSELRSMGANLALSSRSIEFASIPVLPYGVDIVLNSLTSPGMISSSLTTMAEGGHMVEISKRDIFSSQRVAQERPDVCYTCLAVDFLPKEMLHNYLLQVQANLSSGRFQPLRSTKFSIGSLVSAMRQMAQALHIGKITVGGSTSVLGREAPTGPLLITGGLGGLGSLIVPWLVGSGLASSLVLVGRSIVSERIDQSLLDCNSLVTIVSADMSSKGDTDQIMKGGPFGFPPFQGVFHAGGVLRDALIEKQDPQFLREAFAPKNGPLHTFDCLSALHPLTCTIMFSSIASLIGAAGQGNYVAANRVMDAWSEKWSSRGCAAISMQWGAWSSSGMASASVAARLERIGQGILQPLTGLSVLNNVLKHLGCFMRSPTQLHQLAVNPFDWDKYIAHFGGTPYLYRDVVQNGTAGQVTGSPWGGSLASERKKTSEISIEFIAKEVGNALKEVLGSIVSVHEPLMSAGIDSLGAVEYVNLLSRKIGIKLPSTLVFDYPTLSDITSFLSTKLSKEVTASVESNHTPLVLNTSGQYPELGPICVSGVVQRPYITQTSDGCKMDDCIVRIPHSRWDLATLTEKNEFPAQFCGAIADVESFDARAFGISQAEAVAMDPQHRCLLELSAEAIKSCKSSTALLENIGVFIGISWTEYNKLANSHKVPIGPYAAQGAVLSVACGRISYHLGLKGSAMSIDTACSSSLVAISVGRESMLQKNPSCGAIIGGINLLLLPTTTDMFYKANMLAVNGRCKALDHRADGYVRAEGSAVLALCYSAASPVAFIVGSSVNQDGKASSLTAPNGPSQNLVMQAAIDAARIVPNEVSVLQMHGTGTALGDPIEIGAASSCLLNQERSTPLTIMASKTSIGHSEPASGLLGLNLAMRTLVEYVNPAILHLQRLNPHILSAIESYGEKSCVHIPRQVAPLSAGLKPGETYAGVSAFAFQGTNAHVVFRSAFQIATIDFSSRDLYKKQRFWAHTDLSPFLRKVVDASSKCTFSIGLMSPNFVHMWDHKVNGRSLMPGAALMETSIAALESLVSGSDKPRAILESGLIKTPLLFGGSRKSPTDLLCSVDLYGGAVNLFTTRFGVRTSHLEACGKYAVSCTTSTTSVEPEHQYLLPNNRKAVESTSWIGVASIDALLRAPGRDWIDPAETDCCFQIGALLQHQHLTNELRVPVGMDIYQCGTYKNSTQMQCAIEYMDKSSSYRLHTPQCSLARNIQGLKVKTMAKTFQAASPHTIQTFDLQGTIECMYKAEIKASEPDGSQCTVETQKGIIVHPLNTPMDTALKGICLLQGLRACNDESLSFEISSTCQALSYNTGYNDTSMQGLLGGLLRTGATELNMNSIITKHNMCSSSCKTSESLCDYRAIFGDEVHEHQFEHDVSASVRNVSTLSESCLKAESSYRLVPQPRGSLDSLIPIPTTEKDLGPDCVLLSVKAVGVNFRDVLNILGMYPGDPGPPGGDCAGIVSSAESNGKLMGETVFGLAPGCMGSSVIASAEELVPMPPNLSFEAAATMPTVFITADIACHSIAAISSKDRILVHAAAGGVGLACMELVRAAGAQSVVTAGSPMKRCLIRQSGVFLGSGSRSLEFVDDVAIMGGADVVVNSLTSSGMVAATLASLKYNGKAIEISKRDIWSSGLVGHERPDVDFSMLAVDFLPSRVVHTSLSKLAARVAQGVLHPLSHTIHKMSSVTTALRQMGQARHIGKVVISNIKSQSIIEPSCEVLKASIVGGLGALGCLVSKWLSGQGATKLQLLGRSGRCQKWSPGFLKILSGSFCAVEVLKYDVGSRADALDMLRETESDIIFYAGGVLSDNILANQSGKSLREVFAPKMPRRNLWSTEADALPIKCWVLFSSVASLLGSAGQANYSAANGALDELASASMARGQPTISIQWGAWAGGGKSWSF